MLVKFKKVMDGAVKPKKAHSQDAGFDLVACKVEWNGNEVTCHTGLAFEIPEGHVGLLFPRSSIARTGMMLKNSVGVLDSCYRGEVTFKFICMPDGGASYSEGDRIGQLIIIPYPEIEFEEADSFSETDRSTGGYGSTGR